MAGIIKQMTGGEKMNKYFSNREISPTNAISS